MTHYIDPNKNDLINRYSSMKTKDLLILAKIGLSEIGEKLMREELARRNIKYPKAQKDSLIGGDYKAILTLFVGFGLMMVGGYYFNMSPTTGLIIGGVTAIVALKYIIFDH